MKLKVSQVELLKSFTREMKVFCLAGAWCGDCVNQCPIFDHFAQAAPVIKLRFFDRDENPDLGEKLSVCGGARVPVVLFVSEDNFQVGMYGDRTLSKYRELVGRYRSTDRPAPRASCCRAKRPKSTASCKTGSTNSNACNGSCRTSGRLRKLHND